MAKRDNPKQNKGDRNTDRKNGKASKTVLVSQGNGTVGKPVRIRVNLREQSRNRFGHITKVIDGHETVVCDHGKSYIHWDSGNGYPDPNS